MTNQIVHISEPAYLQVCICREPHADNVIPLKDLVPQLMEYTKHYGGEGQLQILMCFKDDDGIIKPISREMITNLAR